MTITRCQRELGPRASCFRPTPTPTRPVLSWPELGTAKGLGAAQYRTPQGGRRSELAPKPPALLSPLESLRRVFSASLPPSLHITPPPPSRQCSHSLLLTLPLPRKQGHNMLQEIPRRMGALGSRFKAQLGSRPLPVQLFLATCTETAQPIRPRCTLQGPAPPPPDPLAGLPG